MSTRQAEAERNAADLIRFGVIAEVDLSAGRCVVAIGDILSAPLPWLCPRASAEADEGGEPDVVWDPPAKGEQVMVLSAEGDLSAGLVLAGVPSDSVLGQLGDARGRAVFFRRFRDGSTILFDPEAHELAVELVDPGKARLIAPGGVEITGDVKIIGKLETTDDVTVDGTVKASKDVIAKDISTVGHRHPAGQPFTGKPVA